MPNEIFNEYEEVFNKRANLIFNNKARCQVISIDLDVCEDIFGSAILFINERPQAFFKFDKGYDIYCFVPLDSCLVSCHATRLAQFIDYKEKE